MVKKEIKKCLLFVPPAFTNKKSIDINPLPPLGLGYIASVLENMGIQVKIVDCLMEGWNNREDVGNDILKIGLPDATISNIISEFSPDIVGVNNQFSKQFKNAHRIYEIVKSVDESIITMAGGAHPTAIPELALQDPNLDFVVIGEGEIVVERLVNALCNNADDIKSIDGLGYKENGRTIINPKTTFIEDLDSIQFPARHLMNMELYFGLELSHGQRHHERFTPIITSRGCPAKCTFCTAYKVWGRKYRYRSPENVIEEMKELKSKYNIEELMIEDDNFTANPKRAEKICDMMIEERFNFKWDTPNGVAAFSLTNNLIQKMKDAGCYKINIAVESGNQNTLNNIIKKPLNLSKIGPIIDFCKKIDIGCGVYLIVGMPGDTLEAMWDNYKFARKIKVFDPFISVATPYPGSEIYNTCKEKGYLSDDFKFDDLYIRSFPITTEEWGPKELKHLMKKGYLYLKFYQAIDNPILFTKLAINKVLSDLSK